MLRATRSKAAPLTLVDFNDQRADRLTLLRHRLDHIPGHKVTETLLDFPPLGHEPLREQFGSALKPLENRS